ncbi:MAG: M48 family metallopeptidase [Lachnospiraceae bacterium]|nr:M48 family metallopeptidase [Lachnospiraceae bacterium]
MSKKLDSGLYLHESDKAAMAALKAIPGFEQLMKAFMKIWNEKQFKILNMSTNLKLGNGQLDKYYDMLPPICDKLGIEVPEMYLDLSPYPNAHTYGDTKPFIVLTSGLFDTVPEELIPTVIAHECGHIACHHTLYHTMGRAILNGASLSASGLGNLALYPIQLAFAYWMRCSEFSADRAAAICDGNADNTMKLCMYLAGYSKNIQAEPDVELFLQQAEAYREMIKDNMWNKTLEFIMFQNNDHPLNAVRAYESREWINSERYQAIRDYLQSDETDAADHLPILIDPVKMIGKDALDVQKKLLTKGFRSVTLQRVLASDMRLKNGAVSGFSIDGQTDCKEDYYKSTAAIVLDFYLPKTDEELALEHPGEIMVAGHRHFAGRNVYEVKAELERYGFCNIEMKEMAMPLLGFGLKENNVAKIIINGDGAFEEKSWFSPQAIVVLYYYVSLR